MINFSIDEPEFRELVKSVVAEVLFELNWPQGRLSLTEVEAALALGIGRHVLRDIRLRNGVEFCKVGKRVLYTRAQLDALLIARSARRGRDER